MLLSVVFPFWYRRVNMVLSAFFSLLFVVRLCGYTRIWYPRRDLFSLKTRRASKSRESNRRSKFMLKDRMTVRKDARRQIKLKSLKVPLFQYPESAVEYHQRPGASISEFKPSVQWEAQPGMLAQLPPPCCHAALIFPHVLTFSSRQAWCYSALGLPRISWLVYH